MNIIPVRSVSIEMPLQGEMVIAKLRKETETYSPGEGFKRGKKLRGIIDEGIFEIRLNVEHPGRYLPVVTGEVKRSDRGSMLLLDYRLTGRTRRSLVIWLAITLSLTVFFIAAYGRWLYGLITFSMALTQYIITRENFHLQVQRTSGIINNILKPERKMQNRG